MEKKTNQKNPKLGQKNRNMVNNIRAKHIVPLATFIKAEHFPAYFRRNQ